MPSTPMTGSKSAPFALAPWSTLLKHSHRATTANRHTMDGKWRDLGATGRWFVAVDDEPVGVAVGVDGWSGDPQKREVVGMWVAPSHRRRGMARELLDQVKAWATSDGATTLSLGVREGNEQAMTAYLSMGMRSSGETMSEVGSPNSVIVVLECDLGAV